MLGDSLNNTAPRCFIILLISYFSFIIERRKQAKLTRFSYYGISKFLQKNLGFFYKKKKEFFPN